MKKTIILFFVVILLLSCSEEDANYYYELLPIEEAIVPDEFEYGRVYIITVTYFQPTDCNLYSDILYEYDYDARNVAVISTVVDENDCKPLESVLREYSFRVHALQANDYLFRFWQGEDENGDPIYLEITAPVVNYNNSKINEPKATYT
jgi:hypothetical protein